MIENKMQKLKEIIHDTGSMAVAFSGGVDSAFLLSVTHEVLGDRCVAITIQAQVHPGWEIEESKEFTASLGVRHIILPMDVFSIPGFGENLPDRCYPCKKALFTAVWQAAQDARCSALGDGSHADDTGDYRPGMRALEELKVLSPLLMAGLTKQEIRTLSRQRGLSTADKPSYACMASRIPYNEPITQEKLRMVEKAEQAIRAMGQFGQMRVRHHGKVARIELLPVDFDRAMRPEIREILIKSVLDAGFAYVALDLVGFRSGSMNEILDNKTE